MGNFTLKRNDAILFLIFTVIVLAAPILLTPIGAGYPDILQKFAIFGIFAIGFNILFGLTGYPTRCSRNGTDREWCALGMDRHGE